MAKNVASIPYSVLIILRKIKISLVREKKNTANARDKDVLKLREAIVALLIQALKLFNYLTYNDAYYSCFLRICRTLQVSSHCLLVTRRD